MARQKKTETQAKEKKERKPRRKSQLTVLIPQNTSTITDVESGDEIEITELTLWQFVNNIYSKTSVRDKIRLASALPALYFFVNTLKSNDLKDFAFAFFTQGDITCIRAYDIDEAMRQYAKQ